jgi:hypothetical protein
VGRAIHFDGKLPPGHVTSASTDRLPSPTTAAACRPVMGSQVPITTVYLTQLPHCLTTKCGAQHPASAANKYVLVD